MSFQWLQLRISEEQDRRKREAEIQQRLPRALDEVHRALAACIEDYTSSFGPEAAELHLQPTRLRVVVREEKDGKWEQHAKIEVALAVEVPGFQIDRGGSAMVIEVGMLPGDKLFYRDREKDQYLSMEEVTRRILDRAFFPKLGE